MQAVAYKTNAPDIRMSGASYILAKVNLADFSMQSHLAQVRIVLHQLHAIRCILAVLHGAITTRRQSLAARFRAFQGDDDATFFGFLGHV